MMPMPAPHITCLCPTYKRADLLQNAIACFVMQDYKHANLLILDDAAQHAPQAGERWALVPERTRYNTLSDKFNALGTLAAAHDPDILVVWEDDDIYLPHHLSEIASAYVGGKQFFTTRQAWGTYGRPRGEVQVESAIGRFHASWAYTRELWDELGGYPTTDRLDFDMQMRGAATAAAGGVTEYDRPGRASYVYRWGNGNYHGSQRGEDGFRALWDELGRREVPPVDSTGPVLDYWTRKIFEFIGVRVSLCRFCCNELEPWEDDLCSICQLSGFSE